MARPVPEMPQQRTFRSHVVPNSVPGSHRTHTVVVPLPPHPPATPTKWRSDDILVRRSPPSLGQLGIGPCLGFGASDFAIRPPRAPPPLSSPYFAPSHLGGFPSPAPLDPANHFQSIDPVVRIQFEKLTDNDLPMNVSPGQSGLVRRCPLRRRFIHHPPISATRLSPHPNRQTPLYRPSRRESSPGSSLICPQTLSHAAKASIASSSFIGLPSPRRKNTALVRYR